MSVSEDAEAPYYLNFTLDFTITKIYEFWRIKSTNVGGV
jgi:hypothetical protein